MPTIIFIAIAVAIAALILLVLPIVVPIVLIIGYMYNKVKASQKRISGTMSDFWLNKSEKDAFKEKSKQLIQANSIIEKANIRGSIAGISRNTDGSFSARSNLGKEIRTTLEEYEPVYRSLSNDLNYLQHRPISKWEEFETYIKNAKLFMWSLIAWCAALLYYFLILGKQSISETFIPYLGIATNIFRDEANQLLIVDGDIQMVAVTTIIAILVYFILRKVFEYSELKFSPCPEKVSLENIDSY
jgi:hypothetical protein